MTEDTQQLNSSLTLEQRKAKQEKKRAIKEAKKLASIERLSKRPSSNTFSGEHKWLGGAIDPKTGNIYGIPSHAIEIICISPPSTGSKEQAEVSTIPLPNQYKQGNFKWLRGIIHDGYLYGIPAWSTHGVLKVRLEPKSRHTRGPRVKLLPLPQTAEFYQTKEPTEELIQRGKVKYSNVDRGRWMWHGGSLQKSHDGDAIYCIPSNAEHVLKVHIASERVTEIGPALTNGQNKWYGGIPGRDGCVYGMPYTATGVLRIDPKTDSVEVLGEYPIGGYKWHGGLLAHSTGVIYAFPAHANEVLCVDTNIADEDRGNDSSWRVTTIPIQYQSVETGSHDQQYKWLGGAYGADGCIYGMPSDATCILRIDPLKNEATTFGKVSPLKNKWQGGVLSSVDKCVYAVPADMTNILKIDTDPETALSIDTIGDDFKNVEDKWQGGFLAKDDRIYAIPENIDNVMVITPKVGVEASVEMIM
jgi:hypothetical protein